MALLPNGDNDLMVGGLEWKRVQKCLWHAAWSLHVNIIQLVSGSAVATRQWKATQHSETCSVDKCVFWFCDFLFAAKRPEHSTSTIWMRMCF